MKYILLLLVAAVNMGAAPKQTMYMTMCRSLSGGEYINYDIRGDNTPFCKFGTSVMSAQSMANYFWHAKSDAAVENYLKNNSQCDGEVQTATILDEQGASLSMEVCVYNKNTLGDEAATNYYPMVEINTLTKTSQHDDNKKLTSALLEVFP
ncbi:MAG: hypothetical protein IPM57_07030 [Oligoflexia bacterium]|nr:hypothetical protein [Oligoflexia bacterium]